MSDQTGFDSECERARALLDADDLTAVHVGVIHDDRTVDTVATRRTDGDGDEELYALSLLATHIRAVAAEANVDYETVAADAAAIAAQLEELPIESDTAQKDAEKTDKTDGE